MKKQLHYVADKDGEVLAAMVVELPDELADEFLPPEINNLKENK